MPYHRPGSMSSYWLWTLVFLTVMFPAALAFCPYRCLCFRTTVRCMFLQLETVPEVSPDTTVLDLRFNKIRDIPANTFGNLKNLNTLLLNNNQITKIENDAFSGLSELRYLYLYKNKIRIIQANAFKGLHKLEQLYIHYNKIEKIEANTFSDLPALERLFLHNNKLSRLPPGVFKKLGSLRRLRLDSNALVCDCELLWLAMMLKENQASTQAAATCEFPSPLQGKSLMALNSDDFRCVQPKLTEEPHDVEVSFGGTAYFHCKAEGEPLPDISWLHNNNEITPGGENRYSVLGDGTLMITQAQSFDQGTYECKAKNLAGEVKSRAAEMRYSSNKVDTIEDSKIRAAILKYPLAHVKQSLHKKNSQSARLHSARTSDVEVPMGKTATLPCNVAGNLTPNIVWVHNNEPVRSNRRHRISQRGTLTILNVERKDDGLYQCIASSVQGRVSSSVRLTVLVLPTFLERPRDQEVAQGHTVNLTCRLDGYPQPRISWTKDGRPVDTTLNHLEILAGGTMLRVHNAQKPDEGVYQCHAENDVGHRNSSALVIVRERTPPVFSRKPEDRNVTEGSKIELPCQAKGDPPPQITWRKDGHVLEMEDNHHYISLGGTLHMIKVRKHDEGHYECIAENSMGIAFTSMELTIRDAPYDVHPDSLNIGRITDQAKFEVERAVNYTLEQVFSGQNHGPSALIQIFRFPTKDARELAQSAEVYERALEIIWSNVQSGIKLNLSEFAYNDLLSPHQLVLLANLSGCLVHRPKLSCSDMCFHRKYRTFDGTCNNLENAMWGASLTPFRRLLTPIYENGLNTPVGWTKSKLYHGFELPSARLVSREMITTESVSPDIEYSHMLMQWGQFLDHDIDFSMPAVSRARFVDGVDCSRSCEYSPPCFPIEVPPGDHRIRDHQCMEFVRSSTLCGSGLTSVFLNRVMPREQVNQLTAYIDASNVYGSREEVALHLRNRSSNVGLLRSGIEVHRGKHLLPFNDGQPIDCKRDFLESSTDCFLAGDVRANEQLGLLAMHTLWMREHNRIATKLHEINSHWDDDMLYHEARKIVGAEMQHITYTHWLPKILGEKGVRMLGTYQGYNPNVDPSVSNVFATAALRFGHTLINPVLLRLNASFQPIPQGNVPLRKAFFAPFRLIEEGGIDPLFRGLFYAAAKLRQDDEILNSELTEHLFTPAHLVAQDLASLNIQRSRDHGIPSYNEWRQYCNLSKAETFNDLRHEIQSRKLRKKLERLYGHPGNIDVWVGGVSEDLVDGARFGPTFRCLIVDQFKRLREGDRFWHENPGVFSPEQLVQIKQHSLGRVICDNGDNVTQITRDVFIVPQRQSPEIEECSLLPKMNLDVWKECCHDCRNAGEFNSLTNVVYRTKRSLEYSYPGDRPVVSTERFHQTENEFSIPLSTHGRNDTSLREKDFDITEQRIEGIEELVGRLEKIMHRLTKKLRKLESECNTRNHHYCIDSQGTKRISGEEWKMDNCTSCECKASQVLCKVQVCPPVNCEQPTFSEGLCCPVC